MAGYGRPIFINEAGSTSEGFDYIKMESYGQTQASWYTEILSLALATKAVIGFVFLEFKDRSVQGRYSQFETMGLLGFSGQPKQSYYAVQSLLKPLMQQNVTTSIQGQFTIRALAGNYTIGIAGARGQFQIFENENLTYLARVTSNGQIQLSIEDESIPSVNSVNQTWIQIFDIQNNEVSGRRLI
jgi:hypothetical protein